MENIYIDPYIIDEKVCYKECPIPSVTVLKTSEKEKQKDIEKSKTTSNKDKCELERTYFSGCDKQKVMPIAIVNEKGDIECIKFDIDSAKRKEEIAELTPGWCE